MPPVVHVVESDDVQLEALKASVRAAGYAVEGHGSAQEFLRAYSPARTGCIVVDMVMPDMGHELQFRLERGGRCPPVIFMSDTEDLSVVVRVLQNGAHDFLQKPIDTDLLIGAIDSALATCERSDDLRTLANGRLYALSPRELEVFAHVVRGELGANIARQLAITVRTVKAHRATIRRKLGSRSVALWARLAADAGFSILPITPPAFCGRGGARWKRR